MIADQGSECASSSMKIGGHAVTLGRSFAIQIRALRSEPFASAFSKDTANPQQISKPDDGALLACRFVAQTMQLEFLSHCEARPAEELRHLRDVARGQGVRLRE